MPLSNGRSPWMLVGLLAFALGGILPFSTLPASAWTKAENDSAWNAQFLRLTDDIYLKCQVTTFQNPQFSSVTKHLLPPGAPSRNMKILADDAKPTREEGQILIDLFDAMQNCRSQRIKNYGQIHPGFVAALADNYSQIDQVSVALVRGRISWGEYAEALLSIAAITQSKLAVVVDEVNSQLAASYAQEVQQRAAAQNALDAWNQNQKIIAALRSIAARGSVPRTLSCTYTGGNTIECAR